MIGIIAVIAVVAGTIAAIRKRDKLKRYWDKYVRRVPVEDIDTRELVPTDDKHDLEEES